MGISLAWRWMVYKVTNQPSRKWGPVISRKAAGAMVVVGRRNRLEA